MTRNTLGKNTRLKQRKQIDALFKTGKTTMAYPYRIYFNETAIHEGKASSVLFGVGVSKRYFKKAVDRNYIKRITREAYRNRQAELKNVMESKKTALDLFFIFTGKELPVFSQCENAMESGLEKLLRHLRPKQ